jgi:adenosylcobyric acid synthase
LSITGYEIHMGQTAIEATNAPLVIEERSRIACQDIDGCLSQNGMVFGTYVHGLFHNHDLRRSILYNLAEKKGVTLHLDANVWSKEEHYDKLADLVRKSLDMNLINRIVRGEDL